MPENPVRRFAPPEGPRPPPGAPRPRGRPKGTTLSDSTKRLISEKLKGKEKPPEVRAKMRAAARRRWASQEQRLAQAERAKLQYHLRLGDSVVEEAKVLEGIRRLEDREAMRRARTGVVPIAESRVSEAPAKAPETPLPEAMSLYRRVLRKVLDEGDGYIATPSEQKMLRVTLDKGEFSGDEITLARSFLAAAQ